MHTHVTVSARTDPGRVRPNNEDAFVVSDLSGADLSGEDGVTRLEIGPRGVLLAVSDGMGGHRAGEVASALVVETISRALASTQGLEPSEAVKAAIAQANAVVWKESRDPSRRGMGATLTALYIESNVAYVAEVGDSRAYVIRSGEMRQLTRDQTVAQVMADTGEIDPERIAQSPFRNVLLQAMGRRGRVRVALARLELRDRDCLLLCSDGLTSFVPDETIGRIVLSAPNLHEATRLLVDAANNAGGKDNITVIAAGVAGDLPASSRKERVSQTFEVLESFDPRA